MENDTINQRAQQILKSLIEQFIRDGQPVGSKSLVETAGLNVSSATVRSVMADLEAMGFIHSPHTSAGRVPTPQGYRFFVDSLITAQPSDKIIEQMLAQQLAFKADRKQLLTAVSKALSGVTQLAGLVTVSTREKNTLKHIEFLPLSSQRILTVLVFSDGQVQNRVIQINKNYSRGELQQAGNFLTELLVGKELTDVRKTLLAAMHNDKQQLDDMMQSILLEAEKALQLDDDENLLLAGEANLLNYADGTNMKRLKQLFQAFNQKQDILQLLDKSIAADGVSIFIGEESGYELLGDCSLVTAPYSVDDAILGVLGVIGPTRMAYEKVVPLVDVTAKLLSSSLK
jgi:heat-inducible transcriptional repressor